MSSRRFMSTMLCVAMLASCRSADVVSTRTSTIQPAPAPADARMLPASSLLTVELDNTLSTRTSRIGDRFTARVINPIVAQNGAVVVPRGAVVRGTVTGLDRSERMGDQALIRVNLETLEFNGRSHPLSAEIVDTEARLDYERRTGRSAATGAAAGAILGAVLSGAELDNILRGAVLGAGAGTVISLGIGDVDATLPSGTDMTLRTTAPIVF